MKKSIKSLLSVICATTIVLGGGLLKPVQANAATKYTPTILVHGFASSSSTFTAMTNDMIYNNAIVTETFIAGSGKAYAPLKPSVGKKPLILVNLSTHSVVKQSQQLNTIIDIVKKQYGVGKINIVAHSMGGVVATYNMEFNNRKDIDKLVTIGSPILGTKTGYFDPNSLDLIPNSPIIKYLMANKSKFDKNTKVLSIASLWQADGDGIVSYKSAYGLANMVSIVNNKPNIKTLICQNVHHLAQTKHKSIIDSVESFLWN